MVIICLWVTFGTIRRLAVGEKQVFPGRRSDMGSPGSFVKHFVKYTAARL
jgi:hypothetical protein